jgi:hypothetical protein
MAATPRTKRSKRAPQDGAKQGVSSVQRRADALSDITLTEQEAEFVDRMVAAPSKLPPEFAPRPVPRADRSILYRTTR